MRGLTVFIQSKDSSHANVDLQTALLEKLQKTIKIETI